MLISHYKKMHGFTLVELMIALVLNILLFSVLVTLFLFTLQHYRAQISAHRLNQQLQTMLLLMGNEIRRAGYWGNAYTDIGLHQNNNPFVASGMAIHTNPANTCLLFAYDHNGDGSLASISNSSDDERYGFRLLNQVIQTRPPGAPFDCNASATSWENMTDSNLVQITQLLFTLNATHITTGPGTKGITMQSVDITLTGRLSKEPSISETMTQHIRIRNDLFIP